MNTAEYTSFSYIVRFTFPDGSTFESTLVAEAAHRAAVNGAEVVGISYWSDN